MVYQLCLMCGCTQNCKTLCLGTRPRYSLVVDEDFKKLNKLTFPISLSFSLSPPPSLSLISYPPISLNLCLLISLYLSPYLSLSFSFFLSSSPYLSLSFSFSVSLSISLSLSLSFFSSLIHFLV